MTRKPFFFLGVFLLAAVGGLHAFPLPPPLETGHILGKGLPAGMPPVPLSDEFYALGWGRLGAFAAMERRNLGDGTREVRFRIYDLVEDRVLFEETWPDWGALDAREAWWADKEPETDKLFARFQLEPVTYQLGEFPLIIDDDFESLAVRPGRVQGNPGWINRLEIVVRSSDRGVKTVQDLSGFWRWAAPLGFIPSPFESRVAVILLVQPAGWAGPTQPLRFLVSGLSLRAGFTAP